MMPDPRGGERLLEYDCEVYYLKEELEYPIKIQDPDDFEPGTKMPKMARKPIWLVTIVMPKKLMHEIQQGSLDLESANLDLEDIESAYEEGEDQDTNFAPEEEMQNEPNQEQPQF
jgi:hypothetical protein